MTDPDFYKCENDTYHDIVGSLYTHLDELSKCPVDHGNAVLKSTKQLKQKSKLRVSTGL